VELAVDVVVAIAACVRVPDDRAVVREIASHSVHGFTALQSSSPSFRFLLRDETTKQGGY
jgi:hypothetical protein